MVLVTGGDGQTTNCRTGAAVGSSTGGGGDGVGGGGMEKTWGVTVAPPPPPQAHKRHDPAPWHKHDITDKERAKQLRKLIYIY